MIRLPGIALTLERNGATVEYHIKATHWESLKRQVEQKEYGWVELESIYGSGVLLCRVEDIADLFLMTESYCEERNAHEEREKLTDS